jgi:hypothetical protein
MSTWGIPFLWECSHPGFVPQKATAGKQKVIDALCPISGMLRLTNAQQN